MKLRAGRAQPLGLWVSHPRLSAWLLTGPLPVRRGSASLSSRSKRTIGVGALSFRGKCCKSLGGRVRIRAGSLPLQTLGL
eukprot:12594533-Alexandrium_andersonii.AAC.1